MAWTIEAALNDPSIHVIEQNDAWGLYRFRLGSLNTEITVKLCRSPIDNATRFERSHDIHTPTQVGPYHESRLFWDDPAYALHNAVNGVAEYYREATKAGHPPREDWLVENEFTGL